MKALYLVTLIYIGLKLTGCATSPTPAPSAPAPKNPLKVAIYPKGQEPKSPYTVIGMEQISKYNTSGIKRQGAILREHMSELAAAMGGDAVINLQHDEESISGTIVVYDADA